ncbi:MAG: Crp/Fnr family transcriptional regulator [Bdellovibrionaceae bacterium]|nr:Crp/Fnr family transcriptional regulator [Pseudobdellovibrionaceae bacterium]
MSKSIKVDRGQYLFREGDLSTSMYIIKNGRLAITKKNFNSEDEVILSEKVNGELLGEMAFFDNKPRSASAKAMISSEVFELPFAALQEQFNTCPAWLKVMTKTINTQLRDANIRIKNLENIVSDTKDKLMPHMLLRVCAVADLLCYKAETDENENKVFPYKELYNVLVQVFHQNKQKINKALKALKALNLLDIIENDDGQMIVVHDQHTIYDFTIWFQENLAKESGKQVAVEEKDLPNLHILAFYGQNEEIAAEVSDGIVKVHVDHIQKNSKLDLSLNFPPTCIDGLMKKGVIFEKQADDVGVWISYDAVEVTKLFNYWTLIYTFNNSDESA